MNDKRYFAKAKESAELSDFARARIGCIAVYNNKIISVGINSHKTHPVQKMYNKYRNFNKTNGSLAFMHAIHAEIDCLLSVDDKSIDMNKVHIYIYRLTKTGMGLSKPCPACYHYLLDRGIRNVHYTTDNSYVYEKYEEDA